jgi:uncharacterized protein YdeI (YjbR/CyaY-like superfamily)
MSTLSDTTLPADIQSALDTNEAARSRFAQLPASHQREYLKHINEAKKPRPPHRKHARPPLHIESDAHHSVDFSDLKLP